MDKTTVNIVGRNNEIIAVFWKHLELCA